MDGKPLFSVVAAPSGLSKDGASTVYRRIAVAAEPHRFEARLVDTPYGSGAVDGARDIDLQPGRVLVIDYDAKSSFVFRG